MATSDDVETTKQVKREFLRRPIDSTQLDIHASHGVVYIRGPIFQLKGHPMDLHHEMEIILRTCRQKPGVRDVIAEVDYPRT